MMTDIEIIKVFFNQVNLKHLLTPENKTPVIDVLFYLDTLKRGCSFCVEWKKIRQLSEQSEIKSGLLIMCGFEKLPGG